MKLILGRQAILDRDQKTVAYELLFRTLDNSPITSDTDATASVLINTLNMFGSGGVLGAKKGFVNLGIDILRRDILDVLPPNKFVLEILETQIPDEELIQQIKSLKRRGYIIALDDFIISEEQIKHWHFVLKEVHIVKVDVLDSTEENLRTKLELLKPYQVHLLAEKVETIEMFELCHSLGFDLFQGYYFTKPVLIEGEGFDPNSQGIIKVIKLIQSDRELPEIEETIKMYPDLTISMLKLANSASVSPINEITSIKQTLALIGKRAISQWMTLMLYAQKSPHGAGASSNPLFVLAAQRGKMMEQIIRASSEKPSRALLDESFLVGLLSLSDTLLGIPLPKILDELSVSTTIQDAILQEKGSIGVALKMVLALEQQNIRELNNLAAPLKIGVNAINKLSIDAYKYALELGKNF